MRQLSLRYFASLVSIAAVLGTAAGVVQCSVVRTTQCVLWGWCGLVWCGLVWCVCGGGGPSWPQAGSQAGVVNPCSVWLYPIGTGVGA
jgi:hypothetical protein